MPKQYDQEAIEFCRQLYCKHGGKNFDAIETEMQARYPSWSKQNLIGRGKSGDARLGWIDEHNFDKSLEEYLKTQVAAVTDDVQKRYLGIKGVCDRLEKKVENGNASRDDIYSYRDFCKLEMEYRLKLDLQKDSYESFAAGLENLLAWLPEIDEKAAAVFLSGDTVEQILARARAEYGKQENQPVA